MRCFFDPGVIITVSGFGGGTTKSTLWKRIAFTLSPVDKSGQPQCIEALTKPVICRPAEAVDSHPKRWSHLRNIAFPEKFPREEQEIDWLGFSLSLCDNRHCKRGSR